jgi:hypothetical protein
MSDQSSDDYLNQPEPVEPPVAKAAVPLSPQLQDDPVYDTGAAEALADFFARRGQHAPNAPNAGETAEVARRETPDTATTENVSTTALEKELREVKRQLALLRLAPQERYPEILKDADIPLDHAREILDCVIVRLKPWVEEVPMTSLVRLKLQTRGHLDARRLEKWAEKTRPQLDTSVSTEALVNNMAASLLAYNNTKFTGDTEEARYDAAYKFVEALPFHAFRLVQLALYKFDAKITTVFSDGFLENF